MHLLLKPRPTSLPEAREGCRLFLRERWRRWSWAESLLPAAIRDDLVALIAWHRLLHDEAREAGGRHPDQRGLVAMARELDDAIGARARSPLGMMLGEAIARHRLPGLLLRGPLETLKHAVHVHAFATRDEVLERIRKTVHPEGRLLLKVLEADTERNVLLSDALATGLRLTTWIVGLRDDLRRGTLHLPVEDLSRFGIEIEELREERTDERLQRLVADQVAWAREHLARGWPLCDALGRWRGRQLAFLLRWHAASLSALEARRLDVMAGPPPAGRLRCLACLSASLLSPS